MPITSTIKLAAELAGIANEVRTSDGDFVAQTAVYALFFAHICNDDSLYADLIAKVSDRSLIKTAESLFGSLDLGAVFAKYLAEGKDPAIYFYEEFLRAYDAQTAKGRGVHYSPPAVVDYMVEAVGTLLHEHFPDAAHNAVVLDPCCGMGAFLNRVKASALPHRNVIGIELSAPVSKLAARHTSCKVLNADSLQEIDLSASDGPLVIIGNPPYSGHSSNAGAISHLMADYKEGLTEKNPKWLQDDYVKFIRMAQHRIDRNGCGIVAFITNHSYLFNPTFRAMRESLMRSFDQVFLLNLYGNSKTNAESELPDENIFKIQMGVAIAFLVKTSNSSECRLMHAEIKATREEKLRKLSEMDFRATPWEEVKPLKPFSVFVPTNSDLQREFYSFASLFDLFEEHSVGFVTSRDSFAIDTERDVLVERIQALRDPQISPDEIRARYAVSDMNIEKAREALLADSDWQEKIVKVLYRPFDTRWAYYSKLVMERPRLPFMNNLMNDNLALAIGRAGQVTGSEIWDVAFVTDKPADLNLFRRGGAMLFPLHSYKDGKQTPNFVKVNEKFFYYIYALLYSKTYRERYADFLKMDYPRIPMQPDIRLFEALSEAGEELANIHLLQDGVEATLPADIAYRIGGWEIPGKYLKDRKSNLSEQERRHLEKIRSAVAGTFELQEKIDALISNNSPW